MKLKKIAMVVMVVVVALAMCNGVSAKTIKLSTKKVTLTQGKTKTVKLKNIKAKKVKSLKVKSSKKKVATVTKKSKTKIKIKAKSQGTSKITVTLKYKSGKKIKTKKLKFTVKVKAAKKAEVKKVKDGNSLKAKLLAKDAKLSGNSGLKLDNDLNVIAGVMAEDRITYTATGIEEGQYDIYLQLGKSDYVAGETMFSVEVNSKSYCIPAKVLKGNKKDMGNFLLAINVNLKAGDNITVVANWGYTNLPFVGDMSLYATGDKVPTGYDGKVKEDEQTDSSDPLSGKTIAWLGSSVTYGYGSGGYTMADEIEAKHKNTTCYKYAINGTTLVNESPSSYVARMKKDMDKDMKIDLLVVQLSTNDATQAKEIGTVSASDQYNDKTVVGAIETIISYAKKTWNCPVMFYTGTKYDSAHYGKMVNALYTVKTKWNIGLIDLWGNATMSALSRTSAQYKSYMKDQIHPTKKGYVDWWTPEFEKEIKNYIK